MVWQQPEIKHGVPTKWLWTIWHPENFTLGKNTDIGAGTHIFCQCGVEIQDDVQIGGGCFIYSKSTIDNKQGKVTIKKGARVGACSVLMPGITIGENATVGACSFVIRSIPDGEIWFGTPAKRGEYVRPDRQDVLDCRGIWIDRARGNETIPTVRCLRQEY